MFELNSILHSLKELLLFVVNLFGPALDASTLETVEAINALSLDFFSRWANAAVLTLTKGFKYVETLGPVELDEFASSNFSLGTQLEKKISNQELDIKKIVEQLEGKIDAGGRRKNSSPNIFNGEFSDPELPLLHLPSDSSMPGNFQNKKIRQVESQRNKEGLKKIRTLYGYLRIIAYNDGSKSYEIYRTGPCRPCSFKSTDFDGCFVVGPPNSQGLSGRWSNTVVQKKYS